MYVEYGDYRYNKALSLVIIIHELRCWIFRFIASFQIPVVISKCIHNNGPLNWKSINMQVIIKGPGWPLPEPTMCLIFIWFSQLLVSVEDRSMHRELAAPRKITEWTKVQKHELAW